MGVGHRYMLKFGTVSDYLGYNALSDFFPQYTMRPNPSCTCPECPASQGEYQVKLAAMPPSAEKHSPELEPGEALASVCVCVCVGSTMGMVVAFLCGSGARGHLWHLCGG